MDLEYPIYETKSNLLSFKHEKSFSILPFTLDTSSFTVDCDEVCKMFSVLDNHVKKSNIWVRVIDNNFIYLKMLV